MNSRLISFANSAVMLEWADDESAGLADFLFGAASQTGDVEPHIHYLLSYSVEEDRFHLTSDHPGDKKNAARGQMALYLMERVTYHLADKSSGGMVFHAACLVKNGAALLLPGESGAGKSSLTVWFTRQGWSYLSDELVHLPGDDGDIQGFPRPVQIKCKMSELFSEIDPGECLAVHPERGMDSPWLIPAAVLNRGRDLPAGGFELRGILFPQFKAGEPFAMEQLSAADCALRLTGGLVNARNLPEHGFPQLVQLARTYPAAAVSYGQFPENDDFLKNYLA